jgi:SAM-dependent methyltransferase
MYLFDNPFSISKRFLRKRGESDIYAYGETPLTTLDTILQECQVTAKDTVFELGCGRGRTCFWIHQILGAKVIGIEYIPDFIERARRIQKKLKIEGVEFRLEDMLTSDFSGGTVFYLYGSCLDDATIKKLIAKFSKLPAGTKIITVSFSLNDYAPPGTFEVMKCFPAHFTWGLGDVYLQMKK